MHQTITLYVISSDFGNINTSIISLFQVMVPVIFIHHVSLVLIHMVRVTRILRECGAEWHIAQEAPPTYVGHAAGQIVTGRETLLEVTGNGGLLLCLAQVLPVGEAPLFVCA